MRGRVEGQGAAFYCFDLESRVPAEHPLRAVKARVDRELRCLSAHFELAYARTGRPSIPVEQLVKASVLQALYSIRSERRLCEELAYNLLYQWFVDLTPETPVWDHSTFSKNRERLARHGLLEKFFHGSVMQAIGEEAAGSEHFSVDGTLLSAWASMKSVRPKDEDPPDGGGSNGGSGNGWVDWRGEKRTNETHESKTDPEARLARKGAGQGAVLAHSMHLLMDNRHGLLMDIRVAQADGRAEREVALEMLTALKKRRHVRPRTLGVDCGYDDGHFLHTLERRLHIVPHVPTRKGPIRATDAAGRARRRARQRQTTRGYALSRRLRMKIEGIFGWLKDVGGLRKTRFVGRWKTQLTAYAAAAAYNFLRLAKLAPATA